MTRHDSYRVLQLCCTLWLVLIGIAAIANSCGSAHAQEFARSADHATGVLTAGNRPALVRVDALHGGTASMPTREADPKTVPLPVMRGSGQRAEAHNLSRARSTRAPATDEHVEQKCDRDLAQCAIEKEGARQPKGETSASILEAGAALPPSDARTSLSGADDATPARSVTLTAARTCYLEATWSKTDCNALLWTAAKRSRAPMGSSAWLAALIAYSLSAASASNMHSRNAMRLPWGDLWGATSAWNERWRMLRQYVARVLSGAVADNCPRATHFGGAMDAARGRMMPARCAVATANRFYAVARMR